VDDAHAAGCSDDMIARVLEEAIENAGFWERAPVVEEETVARIARVVGPGG
jgi:hypothetical protein